MEIYLEAGQRVSSLLDFEALKEIEKLEGKLSETLGERQYVSPLSLIKTLNQAQNQGSTAAFTFPSQGQYLRMRRYFDQLVKIEGPKVLSSDQQSGRISQEWKIWEVWKWEKDELKSWIRPKRNQP